MTSQNSRWPLPSHNFVPEYQQSGLPFVLTKTLLAPGDDLADSIEDYKIEFPTLTRWIKIHSHDDAAGGVNPKTGFRVYFNKDAALTAYNVAGAQDQHYYLHDLEEVTSRLELKCKYIYCIPTDKNNAAIVSIIAGLTSIKTKELPDQTYENGFLGVQNDPNG